MEAESSLPCSQEHAICLSPLSGEPSPHPFIPFNIISPSVSVFNQSLYLASPYQNLLYVSLLPHMCHTPGASHPPWFGHFKKILVKITNYRDSHYEIFFSLLMHTCLVWHIYVNFFPSTVVEVCVASEQLLD